MKFIAVQTGARRIYAAPQILHEAGMLEWFCTDFASNVSWGKLTSRIPRVSRGISCFSKRRIRY